MVSFSERLFYGNSRQNLARILEAENLDEIQRKDQVILPEEIFQKARTDLDLTIADSRERLTHFDIKDEHIQIVKNAIGPELDVSTGQIKGFVQTSLLNALYEAFLAKPIPVILHTHPIVTEEYLRARSIEIIYEGLNLEQSKVLINEIGNFLSSADLGHMEAKGRFVRSMLLASNGGYTWIINPNLNGFLDLFATNSLSYDKNFVGIFNLMAKRMSIDGTADLDRDRVNRYLLGKLYDFCYKKGFVGFYNRDKNSPELTTLRDIPF